MFQRAFSVSTREPAALLFAPGDTPPRGVFVAWCNVGTFVRLCFGVSCDICAGTFLLCDHVRARRGRRGHVVAVAVPWRGRRALDVVTPLGVVVVTWPWRPWMWPWRGAAVAVALAVFVSPSCGCDTPMNASVSNDFHGVSISRFAQSIGCVYSESHQANNNEEKGKISSGYAARDGNPGAPKNRRHG